MKLLVTDYDGTLYQYFKIRPEDLEAIKRFRKQGNLFGIASGRHLESLRKEINLHNIEVDFLIGNNGAIITDHQNRLIYLNQLPTDLSIELLTYMRKNFFDDFYFVGINNGYDFAKDIYQSGASYQDGYVGVLDDILSTKQITALFGELKDPSQAERVIKKIHKDYGHLVESVSNAEFIDIANHGNNKANAVKIVAQYYQIDREDILVVGDGFNDILMIKTFNGYVIKPGYQEVVNKFDTSQQIEFISDILK